MPACDVRGHAGHHVFEYPCGWRVQRFPPRWRLTLAYRAAGRGVDAAFTFAVDATAH